MRSSAFSAGIAARIASALKNGGGAVIGEVLADQPGSFCAVGSNGRRRPPRPRIEVVSATASESEAAAIVAALEQFLVDTAPPPRSGQAASPWQRAALEEGISARQVSAAVWGQAPAPHAQNR